MTCRRWFTSRTTSSFNLSTIVPFCNSEQLGQNHFPPGRFKIVIKRRFQGKSSEASYSPLCHRATSAESLPRWVGLSPPRYRFQGLQPSVQIPFPGSVKKRGKSVNVHSVLRTTLHFCIFANLTGCNFSNCSLCCLLLKSRSTGNSAELGDCKQSSKSALYEIKISRRGDGVQIKSMKISCLETVRKPIPTQDEDGRPTCWM